jgi:hypothetical protein
MTSAVLLGEAAWVEDHLGFEAVKRLIISPDNSLLRGHVLIDDHAAGRGQEHFVGELIVFGSPACPDWEMATRLVKSMLNRVDERTNSE